MEGVTCCLLAAHSPVRREGHTLRRGPSGKKGASTSDVGDPRPVQLAGDATGGDSTATEAEGVRGRSRPDRLSCRPTGPSASSAGARTREGPSRRGPHGVAPVTSPRTSRQQQHRPLGLGRAGPDDTAGAPRGTGRRLPGRPAPPRVTPGPRGRTAWGALGELSPHWAPPPLGANSPFMPLFPSRNGASALACPTAPPQLTHRSTGGDGLSPGRTAPSASLGPVSGRVHGAWGF